MLPTKPFWMVWAVDGGPPRVQHVDRDLAEREAKRLAAQCPGTVFVVLAAVSAIVKDDFRTVQFRSVDDDVPF